MNPIPLHSDKEDVFRVKETVSNRQSARTTRRYTHHQFNRFAAVTTNRVAPSGGGRAKTDSSKTHSLELPFSRLLYNMAPNTDSPWRLVSDKVQRHCVPFAILAHAQSTKFKALSEFRTARMKVENSKRLKSSMGVVHSLLQSCRLLHSWRKPLCLVNASLLTAGSKVVGNIYDRFMRDFYSALTYGGAWKVRTLCIYLANMHVIEIRYFSIHLMINLVIFAIIS